MAEYIRKQAVLNLIDEFQYNHESNTWGVTKDGVVVLKPDTLDKLHEAVNAMPAEDVVKIVRCKDCIYRTFMDWATIWCDFHEINMDQNGYCDQGSKRDGGEQP